MWKYFVDIGGYEVVDNATIFGQHMVNTKRLNWLFLITGFADIKSKCLF